MTGPEPAPLAPRAARAAHDGAIAPGPEGTAPYRVLVTGSRTWTDRAVIRQALMDAWVASNGRPFVLVHGHCPTGADAIADDWGTQMATVHDQTTVERHPAKWLKPDGVTYDRSAGFRRNGEMVLAGANLCLAFIRADSTGATHCLGLAETAGIPSKVWRAP